MIIKKITILLKTLLIMIFIISINKGFAQEKKQKIKAIYIPLADHYAGIVAYELYRHKMKYADYQLEKIPGPELNRARFWEDDVDMAFNVSPIIMNMFIEKPIFKWISLIHRDGNALAINHHLNKYVNLPKKRKNRKPDQKLAEAFSLLKKKNNKPVEVGVPSFFATHTVVLYKYLKDHGKSLGFDRDLNKDVVAIQVPPPQVSSLFKKAKCT